MCGRGKVKFPQKTNFNILHRKKKPCELLKNGILTSAVVNWRLPVDSSEHPRSTEGEELPDRLSDN